MSSDGEADLEEFIESMLESARPAFEGADVTDEPRGWSCRVGDVVLRVWAEPAADDDGIWVARVHARTEIVRAVPASDEVRKQLDVFNPRLASGALVHDPGSETVALHAFVHVNVENASWVAPWFARVAQLQIADALASSQQLQAALGVGVAVGSIPDLGRAHHAAIRSESEASWDEAAISSAVAEVHRIVSDHLQMFSMSDGLMVSFEAPMSAGALPALMAAMAGVESDTALVSGQPHDHDELGLGYLLSVRTPIGTSDRGSGQLSQSLHQMDLADGSRSHLVGAWHDGGSVATFSVFIPGAWLDATVLFNNCLSLATKARWACQLDRDDG